MIRPAIIVFLALGLLSVQTQAVSIGDAIDLVAFRLWDDQVTGGENTGIWPSEPGFTGSIVPGMTSAFERTCDVNYLDSAELGGDYIIADACGVGCNYYGDGAFALTQLSVVSSDPNHWSEPVELFYECVKNGPGGTPAYITSFTLGTEPSTAVFYLAYHAVASHLVDAADKDIWRNAVINYLAQVDDSTAAVPVLALGVATWSLAYTGELDSTLVDPFSTGQPYWNLVKLSDLPALLAGHQRPSGGKQGCFYWRFDHTDGAGSSNPNAYGYTEDAIFGALGLAEATKSDPNSDYSSELVKAKNILIDGIDVDGTVYGHLWLTSPVYYFYAGEMLQALGYLVSPGDANLDDLIDGNDLQIFADNWLATCGGLCCWAQNCDINRDGIVNFFDYGYLANNWLVSESNVQFSSSTEDSIEPEIPISTLSDKPISRWIREPVK
ncbi:MAG: hypothetical protein ACYSSL_09485 [Planctomycetota bacterium]|jgi:hypothetical protein